jgi:uncharacterized damage-inducible protein DinB
MRRVVGIVVALVLIAGPAMAQTSDGGPLSASLKRIWDGLKRNLTESADKMPEDGYGFRPVGVAEEVRTFGQFLAHIAAGNMSYCGRAKSEAQDVVAANNKRFAELEKSGTRDAIIKGLGESVAYCDAVYGSMTDAKLTELVAAGQNQVPRAQFLIQNISHDNEHYGNLVTYFRAKGMVPPSTERTQKK